MKQYKTDKAPIVINILVYAGRKIYTGPKHMNEIFENPELAKNMMFQQIHVIDLQSKEIEELSKDGKASVAEILLKLGVMRNIYKLLEKHSSILKAILQEIPYLEKATDYIFYLNSGESTEKVVNLLKEMTQNEEMVMTLAQHFRNEGIREGKLEGILKTAKNMLKMKLDSDTIHKATGLSQKEIEELKRNK